MKLINIDDRLMTVAKYVRTGSVLADVGTDHAYLPVYLIQKGTISHAIASDINSKPLKSAKSTVSEYNLSKFIELRECNGLDKIDENEVDDIVIAGMGGEMIADILSRAKWTKSDKKRLILQPMSKAELLRKFLCENGYKIIDENAAIANSKVYTVMCVEYDKNYCKFDDCFFYIGLLLDKNDEKAITYKNKIIKSLVKKANGLKKSNDKKDSADSLLEIAEKIKESIK